MTDVQQFYDGFADEYQFLFQDWEQSVHRQASIIHDFLLGLGEDVSKTVLDRTCGIGTQAIGLATIGYQVHGTDLSPKAIERAKQLSVQFETPYPLNFDVADLLHSPVNPSQYDIVLAYDNPIAHFHSHADLLTVFQTMAAQLTEGGLLTTSLRDYDAMVEKHPKQSHISVTEGDYGRRIMFQVWDWHEDGSSYQSEMFVITQDGDAWQTESYKSNFRAWQRADVSRILAEAGLHSIEWHMPQESGYYQAIVTARK